MKTIYLVACAKSKRKKSAAAKDIYVSALFSKSRAHAEKHADRWYILSAKHHLLSPDQIIEDYDLTLKTMGRAEQAVWSKVVLGSLKEVVELGDTVVFLAGNDYRKNLETPIKELGCSVEVPMKGLRIGYALQWLDSH